MTERSIEKVYNTYARFYDQIFGTLFHPGRHNSVDIINKNAKPDAQVLEVGVGTGLSLPLYRADLNVTGIDISENMLKKAATLCQSEQVKATVSLKQMNAEHLAFEDNSFDFVAALYVASVVSNVDKFLSEICRVSKPNADIIFVNHFSSENPIMRAIEKKIAGLQSFIGFKSDFPLNAIMGFKGLKVLSCDKANIFGYWRVLHCKKIAD